MNVIVYVMNAPGIGSGFRKDAAEFLGHFYIFIRFLITSPCFFYNNVTREHFFLCIKVKGLENVGKERNMDDVQILDLYWARSEHAIKETANQYGKYCYFIAYNILHNAEDSEECVNDTYMKAWEVIPPQRPNRLSTFLGKITRNLALNRHKFYSAEKRGAGNVVLALEELQMCVPNHGEESEEKIADDLTLTDALNRFLESLKPEPRKIFVQRYWYFSSVKEIAEDFGIGESKVKMSLLRTRKELGEFLAKEGVLL